MTGMKKFFALSLALLMMIAALPALADEQADKSLGELKYTGSMELEYARQFSVDYYEGGYKLITLADGARMLTVPEGAAAPEGLPGDVMLLEQPVSELLISSAPTTSLINALGRLDAIRYTTTDVDGWYIDEVKSAMQSGALSYIGSYKEPDFEVLAAQPPKLCVFSTMIDSAPDVAGKLGELGINFIRDLSTYEDHPLARVEWIKLYGVLLDADEQAQAVFDAQKQLVEGLNNADTGKSCAIFYITSKGTLHARNGSDYVTRMLELAGGEYALADFNPEKTGAGQIEPEEFYSRAADADYIIYIWSVGGKPEKLSDLAERWDMVSDMRACKDGNVYCTTPDFFQISDTLGSMIVDINSMLNGNDDELTYLFKLQ